MLPDQLTHLLKALPDLVIGPLLNILLRNEVPHDDYDVGLSVLLKHQQESL